jgi:hypothetical protein
VNGQTAQFYLFGDDPDDDRDTAAAVVDTLERKGGLGAVSDALGGLSEAGQATVTEEIATVAAGLAAIDISAVLVSAWSKYAALADAARATVADPAAHRVVDVAAHEITSEHKPYVDVLVNEVRVTRVAVELRLVFLIVGLAATVRQGRLVGLRGGRCDLTASLAVERVPVASRPWQLDLPLVVRLGDGVPLLAA